MTQKKHRAISWMHVRDDAWKKFLADFTINFNVMASHVHMTAKDKGWWDNPRNDGELLMLIVTELAEACEALRHGNQRDDKIPEFSGLEAELADAIIRIMDMASARKLNLAGAICAKALMNKKRPYRHGGKKF